MCSGQFCREPNFYFMSYPAEKKNLCILRLEKKSIRKMLFFQCKKRQAIFPSPARIWLLTSRLGMRKSINCFTVYSCCSVVSHFLICYSAVSHFYLLCYSAVSHFFLVFYSAVSHVSALIVMSTKLAPGESPQMTGVRDQRLTACLVAILVGESHSHALTYISRQLSSLITLHKQIHCSAVRVLFSLVSTWYLPVSTGWIHMSKSCCK